MQTDIAAYEGFPLGSLMSKPDYEAATAASRIGFYHSLVDIRHPASARAAFDPVAGRQFLDFTVASLQELMTRYGRIDCLWYDVALPFRNYDGWESVAMNQLVRRLQPGIIINDRSRLPEDHDTPRGPFTINPHRAGTGKRA